MCLFVVVVVAFVFFLARAAVVLHSNLHWSADNSHHYRSTNYTQSSARHLTELLAFIQNHNQRTLAL